MVSLVIENLTKIYNDQEVLCDLSFSVSAGEMLVVVGPSGCGKSTLLRLIAGLDIPNNGEIFIDNKCMNKVPARDRNIAFVFQNYALYPHMTVEQNLAYGLKMHGVRKAERTERVHEVAELLEIKQVLQRKPNELSGGQRQRVAIGRAIVRKPAVLLFDEPLSNLDAKLRSQMRIELKKWQTELGITSVYVTHDQVEAMTLADKLIVLNGGCIEQTGKPIDLYQHPQTKFVAGFLGMPQMNFFPAIVNDGNISIQTDNVEKPYVLPKPASLRAHSFAGEHIQLGIRPEHIQLATTANKQSLPITIKFTEYLGAEQIIYASIDGTVGKDQQAKNISAKETGAKDTNATELPITLKLAAGILANKSAGDTLLIELPESALHIFRGNA